MTRVDFYILDDPSPTARQVFACRVAEKAHQQGHRVYLHTTGPGASAQLDTLLWTFRDGSFVPHGLLERDSAPQETPVHIGHGQDPGPHMEVLINLAEQVPPFFSRFERVAEVITADPQQKALGRERFRYYKERGYELKTHNIGN